MRTLLAAMMALIMTPVAFAQEATPEGEWRDSYGTTLQIQYCGEGETQLCAVLLDIQGDSRTEENLAYVNQQIMQAEMTAENQWKGTVIFDGQEAEGTLTQVAENTIEIQGCRALILCQTLSFERT